MAALGDDNPERAWEAKPNTPVTIDFGKLEPLRAIGCASPAALQTSRQAMGRLPWTLEYSVSEDGQAWNSFTSTLRSYGGEWLAELPDAGQGRRYRYLRIQVLSSRGDALAAIGEISTFQ